MDLEDFQPRLHDMIDIYKDSATHNSDAFTTEKLIAQLPEKIKAIADIADPAP